MEEKSYVGTGFYMCPVCGNKHGEELLIDKRMKATLTKDMYLGQTLCDEDQKKFDEGFIAFVECENNPTGDTLNQEDAVRTGRIFHIRQDAIEKIFNTPPLDSKTPLVFCQKEVGDILTNMVSDISNSVPTSSTLH